MNNHYNIFKMSIMMTMLIKYVFVHNIYYKCIIVVVNDHSYPKIL